MHRYDGEFPQKYFQECLEYMRISEPEFWRVADGYRQPHIWEFIGNEWRRRKQVY